MATTEFLTRLKEKLSTGNRRSIHLNALPGSRVKRLDLSDLGIAGRGLDDKFLETLLTKPRFRFNLEIDVTEETGARASIRQDIIRRLSAMQIENRDNYLEHGVQPFAIGYPLLIRMDPDAPGKMIKAPVLIWHLGINRSIEQAGKFTISRSNDDPVEINPVLKAYLESDVGISMSDIDVSEEGLIEGEAIEDYCTGLLRQLNVIDENLVHSVVPAPDANMIKHLTPDKPIIRWSGVFGMYKSPKESIIRDINHIIEHPEQFLFEKLPVEPYGNHNRAAVPTDPSQQLILESLHEHPKQIIQGPPGTGKSQSLTALITNALENRSKVLVVCEKRTALEVISENLERIGLGDLQIIIEDIHRDRARVVDSVRDRVDNEVAEVELDERVYDDLVEKQEDLIDRIQTAHGFLGRTLLENSNWTDLIGRYLELLQSNDPEKPETFIDKEQYAFNTKEWLSIKELLSEGKIKFDEIGVKELIFEKLADNNFASKLVTADESNLRERITRAGELISELRAILSVGLQTYGERLAQHIRSVLNGYQQLIANAQTAIENGRKYGKNFMNANAFQRMVYPALALFSGKYKHINTLFSDIRQNLIELETRTASGKYVEPSPNINPKTRDLHLLEQELNTAKQRIEDELAGIDQNIENILNELEPKGFDEEVSSEDVWTSMDGRIDEMYTSLRGLGLWIDSPTRNQRKFRDVANAMNGLTEELRSLEHALPGFHTYHNWRHFQDGLMSRDKTLLKFLKSEPTETWLDLIETWYIAHCIRIAEAPDCPSSSLPWQRLNQVMKDLKDEQVDSIRSIWSKHQELSVEDFNKRGFNIKRLYNKRGSKGKKRNSLRQILEANFNLFTDFFPVLLVNPVVCSSIVPMREGLFDMVIFDEASQLRIEDTYPALLRGKHRIVSGDVHQMPPSDYFASRGINLDGDPEDSDIDMDSDLDMAESDSLLDYAEESGYHYSYLDFHYRSRHPALIDFSNAAFYKNRLLPLPPVESGITY